MNILIDILNCYCLICIGLMFFGTIVVLLNPLLVEQIKYQVKLKFNMEIKTTYNILLYYYLFCWLIIPILLYDAIKYLFSFKNN